MPVFGNSLEGRRTVARRDEEEIVAADQPHGATRKHRLKCRRDRTQIGAGDVVGVHPLADDAARLQPAARRLKELAGEERRHARHPRVRGLGDDDVIAPRCQREMRSAVANNQPHATIVERVAVHRAE